MAETLKENLIPLQESNYPDGLFYFIHDNAKPHKFGPCNDFLSEYLPHPIEHPPKSPDINPIEKIGGSMKEIIYEHGGKEYSNRKMLKKDIQAC